jgi:hypothetical protein
MGGADRDIDSDGDAECAIPGLATLLHSARRNGLACQGRTAVGRGFSSN